MGAASSILSPQGPDGRIIPPAGYQTPNFPGLYTPTLNNVARNVTEVDGEFLFFAEDVWHFTLYWCLLIHTAIFLFPALWFTFVSLFSRTSSLTLRRSPVRKFEAHGWTAASRQEDGSNGSPDSYDKTPKDDYERLAGESVENGRGGGTSSVVQDNDNAESSSRHLHNPSADIRSAANTVHRSTSRLRSSFSTLSHHHHLKVSPPPPPASAPLYLAFLPLLFMMVWATASALIMGTIIGFTLSAVFVTANFEMSTYVPFMWAVIEGCIVVISSYSTVTAIL